MKRQVEETPFSVQLI